MIAATGQPPFCSKIEIKTKKLMPLNQMWNFLQWMEVKFDLDCCAFFKTQKKEICFKMHRLTLKDTNRTGKT